MTPAPESGSGTDSSVLLPSIGSAAVIATLLLLPVPADPEAVLASLDEVRGFDKWVHFVLFALGSVVWRRGLGRAGVRRAGLATGAFGSVYAFALEVAQGALPTGRSPDAFDLLAGAFGSWLVVAVMGWNSRRRSRSGSPPR